MPPALDVVDVVADDARTWGWWHAALARHPPRRLLRLEVCLWDRELAGSVVATLTLPALVAVPEWQLCLTGLTHNDAVDALDAILVARRGGPLSLDLHGTVRADVRAPAVVVPSVRHLRMQWLPSEWVTAWAARVQPVEFTSDHAVWCGGPTTRAVHLRLGCDDTAFLLSMSKALVGDDTFALTDVDLGVSAHALLDSAEWVDAWAHLLRRWLERCPQLRRLALDVSTTFRKYDYLHPDEEAPFAERFTRVTEILFVAPAASALRVHCRFPSMGDRCAGRVRAALSLSGVRATADFCLVTDDVYFLPTVAECTMRDVPM